MARLPAGPHQLQDLSKAESQVQVTQTHAPARLHPQLSCYPVRQTSVRRRRVLRKVKRVLAWQKGSDDRQTVWPLR
jgi:hypothetical protein